MYHLIGSFSTSPETQDFPPLDQLMECITGIFFQCSPAYFMGKSTLFMMFYLTHFLLCFANIWFRVSEYPCS